MFAVKVLNICDLKNQASGAADTADVLAVCFCLLLKNVRKEERTC
jgi:hypothetical protein